MAYNKPAGAPENRKEEWCAYLGGDGTAPADAPQNRREEWYLWFGEILQEKADEEE